ncbi:ubiquitin-protein ligase E3A isoform X2 [Lucilia sericata]|uniref:ubiquitin-protein ligase E3A isoform X2 n=1 Tax=Lucilia sericata TaxID=13632 RepID=UPI0018A802C8|nr:ubiquitin-protein ligase E3A isoform X2 [Lucilia sericata]
MNPTEADEKLPSKKAEENETPQDHSMSDEEENTSFPEDLSFRQRQLAMQQTNASAPPPTTNNTTPNTRSTHSSDMKRSAVKELIERYFYQLQRGCGNPQCSNKNCASSGQVAPMTPNEIAAKAIQLFSQDAKLCECYNTQQPPKVPRTGPQHESPTSSNRSNAANTPLNENMDSLEHSSSTSNSTITSGSSSTSSSSTGSSNTNISSCATIEMPLLVALGEVAGGGDSNADDATTSAGNLKTSDPPTPTLAPVEYLNEQILDELIEECKKYKSYDRLIHAINDVYCSVKKLSKSFRRPPLAKLTSTAAASKLQELLGKSPQELKKEDLRTLEGEHDKDEDSTCLAEDDDNDDEQQQVEEEDDEELPDVNALKNVYGNSEGAGTSSSLLAAAAAAGSSGGGDSIEPMDEDANSDDLDDIVEWSQSCDTQVDFESLRRVKKKLNGLKRKVVREAINENIILLAESIKYGRFYDWEKVLHCFVICFDMSMAYFEYMEVSMPKVCQAAVVMPVQAQARLARIWATHYKDNLHPFIQSLQQLIALQVMLDEDAVQENPDVIAITKVLKIVFYANILAGEVDAYNISAAGKESAAEADAASSSSGAAGSSNDDDNIFHYNQILYPYHAAFAEDKLEKELNISCMDCRVPLVPYEEFYNETLSDAIQMDRDYLSYKNLSLDPLGVDSLGNHFSFMLYSFILTPATKVIALYYDSRIRMYSERNSSLYSLLYYYDGNEVVAQPNLKLKVRRDNIVNDALIGLELVAMSNPKDLKKQLVVEFVGEQGIDEGGVSKEFFQLIVEELFNPDFGMFTHQEDTNTMWFNSTPFENEAQFTLIGIIIGLAIYNNIILAVNFPMVVYRKLMGGRGSFYDLQDWNPTLYRSLKSMLDYEEPDMEEVFMQTFKISYKNVFDEVVEHELKPGGGEIVVCQENKREFVDLYSDFLLNKNIERQFKAFKKGFDMVTDESPLKLLFRPEEVELLVCGSRKFDFMELEDSTEYEGGYTKETQIIKDFWSIVHNLPEESKRKLLEFTTGSDRVPVGGLSRLKLLITRHGPDSDRLPTSHTCFNVLLLPEYSSKEKLEERLLKAINYSKGFGML